ncbi:MAG: DUF3047 domain-containing protein [Candidatus Omnitrophota bacterium]|nr:DUF3047 domain-containing protein [Candidatus Omnitrophota bacterium]
MRKTKLSLVVISIILIALITYAYNLPKFFKFNKKDALGEWQEKVFRNRVLYIVEPEIEGGRLLAKSKNACSGLLYKIRFNSKVYPLISWKWRVIQFPEKSSAGNENPPVKNRSIWDKLLAIFRPASPQQGVEPSALSSQDKNVNGGWLEKDDYAARIYVIFPSWIFTNIRSLEYVWDETKPEGTIIASPYFSNIKLIVVRSGRKNPQEWVFEERNIYEDYKRAFGKNPGWVGAIAIMTDTDNTLSTAEALYTDIKVGYNK